jgi:indolepyruvate ferredoxin oxidoreductase
MRIGPAPDWIHAIRISAEEADTLLGCDIVVAGSRKALASIKPGESRVFVNLHETYPGDFTRAADFSLPTRRLRHAIEERAGAGRVNFVEAERLAKASWGRHRHQHADGRLCLAAGRPADQPRVDP